MNDEEGCDAILLFQKHFREFYMVFCKKEHVIFLGIFLACSWQG